MKQLLALATVTLFGVALAYTPQAEAQAFVINKADGMTCGATIGPNKYDGAPVLVATPSGNVTFHCTANLTAGPGVSQTTVTSGAPGPFGTTCHVTETVSGNANASCH